MSYSEVKTLKAKFRILHRLEGKKILPGDLPKDFDGVLVEMVHTKPIEDSGQRAEAYVAGLEEIKDLSLLVEKVKKNKAKIFFGDLAENKVISSQRDLNLMLLEFLAGLVLISESLVSLLGRRKKQGRAWFLWPFSLILLGFWLISSVFEILGIILVQLPGNVAKKGLLQAVRETVAKAGNVHPEKSVVFLRNLVLAEKAWEMAKTEAKRDSKPLFVLDLHFGHAGIAEMLSWSPRFRRALLRLYRPFMKPILKDPVQRDYLARLISVSWNDKGWQVEKNFLVDNLEAL